MARCPYLEEILKSAAGPLRRYSYTCHVDHLTKRRLAIRDSPPICLRNFEDCPLYRQERGREDRMIRRYTD